MRCNWAAKVMRSANIETMSQSPKTVLYVIGPVGGPFKIGIADNVKSRRSILNVGNPAYLRIIYYHYASSEAEAREMEAELHYNYQDKHIRGEWFQLDESDLPGIVQAINNVSIFKLAPSGWTLRRKSCDEFTPEVCRKARGALGLSIAQLAEKADLSEDTVENFETSTSSPQVKTLEALRSTFEAEGIEFVREKSGTPLKILI